MKKTTNSINLIASSTIFIISTLNGINININLDVSTSITILTSLIAIITVYAYIIPERGVVLIPLAIFSGLLSGILMQNTFQYMHHQYIYYTLFGVSCLSLLILIFKQSQFKRTKQAKKSIQSIMETYVVDDQSHQPHTTDFIDAIHQCVKDNSIILTIPQLTQDLITTLIVGWTYSCYKRHDGVTHHPSQPFLQQEFNNDNLKSNLLYLNQTLLKNSKLQFNIQSTGNNGSCKAMLQPCKYYTIELA